MDSTVAKAVVALLVGSLLGVLGAKVLLLGSGLILVPWAFAGLDLGAWCIWRQWLLVGLLYGFALAFVFMTTGYSGTASLVSRLPFFALLGLFGALCGAVLTLLGSVLARRLTGRGRSG